MSTGMHRKPGRYTIREAGDAIRRRETFVAGDGSLTAEYLHGAGPLAWGRAPDNVTNGIREARGESAPLYVVLSYGTPIAWAGPGEALTVPDVRYSVTTSKHQNIARRADGHHQGDGCARPHGHVIASGDWNAGYRGD